MIKIKCRQCKKFFFNYPSNHRTLCGRGCQANYYKTLYSGEGHPQFRHGMSYTPFHWKWCSMIQRCIDKNYHKYPIYGGRGIKVCKKWSIFENFKKDMYESYLEHLSKFGAKSTTLDRINVNGDYSKRNCRWATKMEQSNNTRKNINVAFRGETHTLKEWSRILKLNYITLYQRYVLRGWSSKKSFTNNLYKK